VSPIAPAASPVPPEAEHLRWMVTDRAQVDVDGDGIRERLIVRENLRRDTRPQIAVHFVDGRVDVSTVRGWFRNDGLTASSVDDRPGEELLVSDLIDYSMSVWSYRDSTWQRLPVDRPRLFRTSIGRDGHGYDVFSANDRLLSYRSVLPFDVGYDYAFPPGPVYEVDAWSWHYSDGRLTPRHHGRWCVSANVADHLIHCA
jgi:hypothetical protein